MPLLKTRRSEKRRRERADEHAPKPKRRPAPRPQSGPPIIDIRDTTVVYPGGHVALERVSASIYRGEFAFVVGPTGCGK
jgi:ABC-type multidrug transport system fused ATPase/permease subunit